MRWRVLLLSDEFWAQFWTDFRFEQHYLDCSDTVEVFSYSEVISVLCARSCYFWCVTMLSVSMFGIFRSGECSVNSKSETTIRGVQYCQAEIFRIPRENYNLTNFRAMSETMPLTGGSAPSTVTGKNSASAKLNSMQRLWEHPEFADLSEDEVCSVELFQIFARYVTETPTTGEKTKEKKMRSCLLGIRAPSTCLVLKIWLLCVSPGMKFGRLNGSGTRSWEASSLQLSTEGRYFSD